MRRLSQAFGIFLALAAGVACGEAPGSDISDLTLSVQESQLILELVNHPSTTVALLDDDVRLDSRAAANIIAHRDGADAASDADDDLFDDIAELDAIGYVGPSALVRLRDYAIANPMSAPELVEGVELSGYEAAMIIWGVNHATVAELDVDVALDKRAAENLVAAAPFDSVASMGAVAYVGATALKKLRAHVGTWAAQKDGAVVAEIGIVSDLDKTVVPPADPDLSEAPYPGVTKLYQILETRLGGAAGDMYYVTARQPEMVTEIPEYLEAHDVPAGPIETGVSGLPWVAEPEKVADVSSILDATGSQPFLLFGDSSHRDPEVYKTIRATYPDRVVAAFIHKVNATVAPHRVEGLHLHTSYAEVAAILYGYQVISRDEALQVMEAAQAEGLAISAAEMQQLLDAQ